MLKEAKSQRRIFYLSTPMIYPMRETLVVRSGAYTADSAIIPSKYDGAITGYVYYGTKKVSEEQGLV
jgi:hypothetical protein